MSDSIYQFKVENIQGQEIEMSDYKGKLILIVNTASKCGLTPQYEGLEKLYQQYKDRGLVILGFPCNQFGEQEPGTADDIQEFCQVNYGVSFPMFAKVDVNGAKEHPLFTYLKNHLGGLFGKKIKWNFTKFLVDQNGKPIKRFAPTTKPEKISGYIDKQLK